MSQTEGIKIIADNVHQVQPTLRFVERYYQMNPATEDLIPNGSHLKNGMVVLPGNSNDRAKYPFLDTIVEEWMMDRALQCNRWAKVSYVSVIGNSLTFIATYEDGTKRPISVDTNLAWLVKLNSFPSEGSDPQWDRAQRRAAILVLLHTLASDVSDLEARGDELNDAAFEEKIENVVNKAANEIVALPDRSDKESLRPLIYNRVLQAIEIGGDSEATARGFSDSIMELL